ncbi:MAG: hemerythrin domain-containing protein [Deltaproteobacteria bacterium]|nr:hemerythrin domain-containing protein [Deltaproteobacteria bacterium]
MGAVDHEDPLTRQPQVGMGSGGLSPMDPPEAFSPPGLERVSVLDMHPFLQQLCEEHSLLSTELTAFEAVLQSVPKAGFTKHVHGELLGFLDGLERTFVPHSRQEEESLFPLLNARLLEEGEHGKGPVATTAVDIMKDDHLQVIRLSAVITNFLKIAPHLPDASSALVVRDAALRHAKCLVDALKLHMFREDNVVFAAAQRLLSTDELDQILPGQGDRIAR